MTQADLPVILLMGPTAAGKTDLALELVERLPCDIVSVDSALVYRRMDIGTAKPDAALLARAPHRLIDIREPYESYSAAEFCADAEREIAAIHQSGRLPLLVGGTMLYFKSLQQGLADLPAANPELRAKLAQEWDELGAERMHQRLAAIDPLAAARIHPHDPQRLLRALEVWELTGETLSSHHQRTQAAQASYRFIKLALMPSDRPRLHARIEQRLQAMLAAGFVEEVEALRAEPHMHADLPSMRSVGYRQIWQYLSGEYDYAEMQQRAVFATRQLAKRQLTWLRAMDDVCLFESECIETAVIIAKLDEKIPR